MNERMTEMAMFLSVAKHLSFQKAAIEHRVSRSAISHGIRRLESDLEVRLLHRTTRSLALTEAGQMLHDRLVPIFADMDGALEEINRFRRTPLGTLRLNVPRALPASVLAPVLSKVLAANPGLSLEVVADDGLIDIVAAGFDAGIRFGERLHKDMIAVRIDYPLSFAVVGAPAYFQDHPVPRHPHDLASHQCIRYRFPSGALFPWEFEKGDETIRLDVQGPLVLDHQQMMVAMVLAGNGLAFVFEENVRSLLAEGRLVRCLDDWCAPFNELYLYFPDRKLLPAGLRVLIDTLRQHQAH